MRAVTPLLTGFGENGAPDANGGTHLQKVLSDRLSGQLKSSYLGEEPVGECSGAVDVTHSRPSHPP